MSIMFSWRVRWSCMHHSLSLMVQQSMRKRPMCLASPAQLLQAQVRQVTDTFVAVMRIGHVENCLEVKARIACWHRCIYTYRGHLLCSDASERTFLMDTRTWDYIAISNAGLLQIDGVKEAKMFIDALCQLQEKKESNEVE